MERRTTVLATLLLVAGIAHAQPNKEQYELQERRCGKQAAEVFAKRWGSGVKNSVAGQSVAEYLNHYNSRLNKCIYLETINTYTRLQQRRRGSIPILFSVQAKWCQTEAEWRTLIKPFMED